MSMEKIKCPVCGQSMLEEDEICIVCFWENDTLQLHDPDYAGGANEMSLNQARETYKQGKPIR